MNIELVSKLSFWRVFESRILDSGVLAEFTLSEAEVLERFGRYQTHEFPSGERITVLPTCTVPLDYLVRENWVKQRSLGSFRGVADIVSLSNRIDSQTIVKSPERVLTRLDCKPRI